MSDKNQGKRRLEIEDAPERYSPVPVGSSEQGGSRTGSPVGPSRDEIADFSREFVEALEYEFIDDLIGLVPNNPRKKKVIEFMTGDGDQVTVYEGSNRSMALKLDNLVRRLDGRTPRPKYFLEVRTGDGYSWGRGFNGSLDEVRTFLSDTYEEGGFRERCDEDGFLPWSL